MHAITRKCLSMCTFLTSCKCTKCTYVFMFMLMYMLKYIYTYPFKYNYELENIHLFKYMNMQRSDEFISQIKSLLYGE